MIDWVKTILGPDDSMETAINVITKEALRIVMVADEDGRLLGTVTDGDIRRALMRHCTMEARLTNIMHKSPTVASSKDGHEEILAIMKSKDLLQIPVLDDDRKIIGLVTLHHLIKNKKYDNPVFLMAGGFGSRLSPLTDNIPKPLLSVGSKPIMETILEQLIKSGFHNFFISVHYKAEMVRDHFGDGSQWGVEIKYVCEDKPLGTAGALGLLPKDLPNLPILMMNGDLLTRVDFIQLLNYHLDQDGIATLCTREYEFQVPYGVVQVNDDHVVNIDEKPVHKFFINAGVYVLSRSLINVVDGYSYLDMPNFLIEQIEMGEQVNIFPIHEYWLDIGHIDEFDRANKEIVTSFNN